jgi:tetratricopeptide (TPR) repeat protein
VEKQTYEEPEALLFSVKPGPKGWAEAIEITLLRRGKNEKDSSEVFSGLDWATLVTRQATLRELTKVGARPVFAVWDLSPERSSRLKTGSYEIVAKYDISKIDNNRIPRGDLIGRTGFKIAKPEDEKEKAVRLPFEMARYYLKAKQPDKTIDCAKKALNINKSYESFLGYCFLAEAYEQKNMFREAIAAYEIFLKHNSGPTSWSLPAQVRQKLIFLRSKVKKQDKP